MSETKTFFKNDSEELVLEVRSNIGCFSREACEQVWNVILATGVKKGLLVLIVNKKVTGQPGTDAVKVIGVTDFGSNFVKLKFQASPDTCFEGTLSLRVDRTMEYGTRLKEILTSVAGVGWYSPGHPETKQVARPTLPQVPLTTVEASLISAAKETMAKTTGSSPSAKGLVKDSVASKEIFRTIAAKLEGGLIDKRALSIVVMSHAAGKPVESGRGAGPIISAWCKMGYIAPLLDDNGKRYILTEWARSNFDLVFEAYKGPMPAKKISEPRTAKRGRKGTKDASANKMLARVAKATANCQKLEKIRFAIAALEAKARKIEKRLAKLKKLAEKPALIESEALMAQLQKLGLK